MAIDTDPDQIQHNGSLSSDFKVINDAVHGHIKLDSYSFDFIDTVQFQRLRDLKQLGATYFVFPGGSHNRFEHSIGVSHLAGTLIERFQKDQPELRITEDEVKCVKLAGLCHDLGHGPFSHVFDNQVMPQARPGIQWSHEQASEMMLEYLIDDNNIDIERNEINLIKDLIAGTPRSQNKYDGRAFLFDIVANKRNSVDVDKFDYIERDAQNLGLRSSYDAKRLLMYSRVVNNEICYHHKEVYNLYEMFYTRYSLFKRIYTHRVAEAVEMMITDAMIHADSQLGISSAVDKPEEYLNLTDDILRVIERSKTKELEKSRSIMRRLRTRDLYKFVDEFLLPTELAAHMNKSTITATEIVSHQSNNDYLTEDDVIVKWIKINYAMKDRNPVDSIRFYSKFNDNESFTIPKQQVSYMIPQQFEEVVVRVFTRNPQKITAIQKAFRRLLKSIAPSESKAEPNAALTFPNDYDEIVKLKRQRSGSLQGSDGNDIVKKWQGSCK
ncbi:HD phosphohydrolase domain-containing protein [Zychaea mexicana]|uniref:HD phosphohydrolase domain-containing protein n=1 Tax=Zychaea mexicana TaxID=64656 RepID=UPI0022FF0077|nr:HD phosphohydrolase domain-containing protein [Zychaea mexicana]KAI9499236.1 HD phosphohydrolase domain-containing protein [Zychaea mexicana]